MVFENFHLFGVEVLFIPILVYRFNSGEKFSVERDVVVMLGQFGRNLFGDGLEFVVRFLLGQTAEYQIDLSQLHTAERFDGVFECRSLGVGNDCGNFGIVLTDAFFKSRHVVLGFYLFERRNPERSAELAKQRILFLIARDHHKTS